jgi:hypothetical protein
MTKLRSPFTSSCRVVPTAAINLFFNTAVNLLSAPFSFNFTAGVAKYGKTAFRIREGKMFGELAE